MNAGVAAALYKPLGIGGIVLGTVIGTVVMCLAQGALLRRELGGVEGRRTALAAVRMLAAAALLGGASYGVWHVLDSALGRSLPAQVASVGGGISVGLAVYAALVWAMRIPEARQLRTLLPGG